MRVVVDPSVLVSALLTPGGPPGEVMWAWAAGGFELLVSERLLSELGEVLARPKFRRWVRESVAAEFVAGLWESAITLEDPPIVPAITRDADDDYVVALARSAKADYLVSGDRDLTELVRADPPVLTPQQFLETIGKSSP